MNWMGQCTLLGEVQFECFEVVWVTKFVSDLNMSWVCLHLFYVVWPYPDAILILKTHEVTRCKPCHSPKQCPSHLYFEECCIADIVYSCLQRSQLQVVVLNKLHHVLIQRLFRNSHLTRRNTFNAGKFFPFTTWCQLCIAYFSDNVWPCVRKSLDSWTVCNTEPLLRWFWWMISACSLWFFPWDTFTDGLDHLFATHPRSKSAKNTPSPYVLLLFLFFVLCVSLSFYPNVLSLCRSSQSWAENTKNYYYFFIYLSTKHIPVMHTAYNKIFVTLLTQGNLCKQSHLWIYVWISPPFMLQPFLSCRKNISKLLVLVLCFVFCFCSLHIFQSLCCRVVCLCICLIRIV